MFWEAKKEYFLFITCVGALVFLRAWQDAVQFLLAFVQITVISSFSVALVKICPSLKAIALMETCNVSVVVVLAVPIGMLLRLRMSIFLLVGIFVLGPISSLRGV